MITIDKLTKKFPHRTKSGANRDKTAVDELSLSIGPGEIFGLLGPNGAGKTTTIRMLTMQTRPTSGRILYAGQELATHGTLLKSAIGVVPQHVNFDQDLTVGENLELHARLHHMARPERQARIQELLAYMELADVVNDGVRRLSGGMKRRLLIAPIWQYVDWNELAKTLGVAGKPALIKMLRSLLARLLDKPAPMT
mgnify:CR=1 FL=1